VVLLHGSINKRIFLVRRQGWAAAGRLGVWGGGRPTAVRERPGDQRVHCCSPL